MSSPANLPYLLISLSTEPESTWRHLLAGAVTCLGRPESDQAEPDTIDLRTDWASRRHARILRQGADYILENWQGKNGIGVYERCLQPGDKHVLRHGDQFRIPDLSTAYARILFLIDDKTTMRLPLQIDPRQHKVLVFGEPVALRGLEYRLLAYLYDHAGEICAYEDVLGHLWPDYYKVDGRRAELDVYLARVRARLREASGGFTFMQTLRGHGVRLVL
jgi:DNA-binding winged helix-turn-helix (wHTH) protein